MNGRYPGEKNMNYQKLIERSPTGIYVEQGGRFLFANERFAYTYGYTVDEIVGMERHRLVCPESVETGGGRPDKDGLAKGIREHELKGRKKNGECIWLKETSRDIEYRGKPAILGSVVDITGLKRQEEELKQFLYAVSHDLRNPIIAIQGFARRLQKKRQQNLGEKGLQYVGHIYASACQMEQLVTDLLTLSRLGRMKLDYEDAAIDSILDEVMTDLRNQIQDSGVKIDRTTKLPVVRCDRTKLYQVFQNLLTNAIKYTRDSANPEVIIGHEEHDTFHRFYVTDNGIGIETKDQDKIFDMLTRASGSEYREGTGLGLSIVQKIVEGHGGEVGVDSEKGKGATFHFTLPK